MKRNSLFVVFFLLAFAFLNISVGAQTAPCPQVTIEVFAKDPQSGPHNYFGVRITLNQVYDGDVTVTGYIFDEGDPNTDHPFSLTITSSNLTNETSDTYYETTPTSSAIYQVNTQTELACYVNPYDSAGILHNAILDYAFDNISSTATEDELFSLIDDYFVSVYGSQVSNVVHDFLDSSKMTYSYAFEYATDLEDIDSIFANQGRSNGFITYYNFLYQAVEDYIDNPSNYYLQLRSIEKSISESGLSSDEKSNLLSSCSVYRYSAYYWSASGRIADWETKFGTTSNHLPVRDISSVLSGPNNFIGQSNDKVTTTWIGDMIRADGHGAIQGGTAAAVGIALGVVGGGTILVGAAGWGAAMSVDSIATNVWHWFKGLFH